MDTNTGISYRNGHYAVALGALNDTGYRHDREIDIQMLNVLKMDIF